MASTIVNERIEVSDAVNQRIFNLEESHTVASVTKIGSGGFGDVYKICAKRSSTSGEELSDWENPLRV